MQYYEFEKKVMDYLKYKVTEDDENLLEELSPLFWQHLNDYVEDYVADCDLEEDE